VLQVPIRAWEHLRRVNQNRWHAGFETHTLRKLSMKKYSTGAEEVVGWTDAYTAKLLA